MIPGFIVQPAGSTHSQDNQDGGTTERERERERERKKERERERERERGGGGEGERERRGGGGKLQTVKEQGRNTSMRC